ncbi:MAG: hypothetical protein RR559_13950, partial [Bacteroides sp.]
YGNNDYVVNWENDGYEIRHFCDEKGKQRSAIRNPTYYFRSSVTWSDITSGGQHFRMRPLGSIYDVSGMSMFPSASLKYVTMALCNSTVGAAFLKIIAPTMHCQIGDVSAVPIIESKAYDSSLCGLVEENVSLSVADWDSFEISWDFGEHPFAPLGVYGKALPAAALYMAGEPAMYTHISRLFTRWSDECQQRFDTLKANEEELNRIFAEIYHMEGEVPIEVSDDKVSVRRADLQRDIKSLISYGVGCLFGRYSVDQPGLILADQGSTAEDFR